MFAMVRGLWGRTCCRKVTQSQIILGVGFLFLSGCAQKPPYVDHPYTPTGKVKFDSMEPLLRKQQQARSEPVESGTPAPSTTPAPTSTSDLTASPRPSDLTSPKPETTSHPEERVSSSDALPSTPSKSEEDLNPCTQAEVLALKTASYDITICEETQGFRYHNIDPKTKAKTERPALLSDTGYYFNEGRYQYWITKRSIAVYEGDSLVLEEFRQ